VGRPSDAFLMKLNSIPALALCAEPISSPSSSSLTRSSGDDCSSDFMGKDLVLPNCWGLWLFPTSLLVESRASCAISGYRLALGGLGQRDARSLPASFGRISKQNVADSTGSLRRGRDVWLISQGARPPHSTPHLIVFAWRSPPTTHWKNSRAVVACLRLPPRQFGRREVAIRSTRPAGIFRLQDRIRRKDNQDLEPLPVAAMFAKAPLHHTASNRHSTATRFLHGRFRMAAHCQGKQRYRTYTKLSRTAVFRSVSRRKMDYTSSDITRELLSSSVPFQIEYSEETRGRSRRCWFATTCIFALLDGCQPRRHCVRFYNPVARAIATAKRSFCPHGIPQTE